MRASTIGIVLGTTLLAGCAFGEQKAEVPDAPSVLALSRDALSVGDSVEIVGGNFVSGPKGHTDILLTGQYHADDGNVYDVNYRTRPFWEDGNRLTWAQVGPFKVPFSPTGDELGTFEGNVTAINVSPDGTETKSKPMPTQLQILPSIVIKDLQPLGAQCSKPVKRLLGGFAYKVKAEAIGFTPVNYTYIVAGVPGADAPTVIRHKATGTTDSFGENGELVFPPNSAANTEFYIATLGVDALDTKGNQHELALNFGVHLPVEYINSNKVKVAEIQAAEPVSSCIAGGDTNGRTVTYSEQQTDTETRSVGVSWDESWLESHTGSVGGSKSTTNSIDYSVSQSQTSGWEINWSNSHATSTTSSNTEGIEATGKFDVPFLAEAGLTGKYSHGNTSGTTNTTTNGGSKSGSTTTGYTVGRDHSTTDTESWAFAKTQGHTLSKSGSDFWTVSSSKSTIVSFQGFILPGQYGVFYRQTTRLALPGDLVSYNMCGTPTVIAQTNFYDYTWGVDLAQGSTCDPLPKSNLPAAQCFLAPCSTAN